MLTVHHLGMSQSERIVWLCEELEIPYELIRYEREPNRLAPPAYKALYPPGTSPVITDGDLVLGESGAIIEYVIGKYGQGRLALTAEHPDFADYVFWLHFANGTMMPNILNRTIITALGAAPDSFIFQALGGRADVAYQMVEERLGQAPYFAGEAFTAADIIMGFPLTTMRLFSPRDISAYPNIRAYLKRIGERPGYRRAMAKADPDMPLQLA